MKRYFLIGATLILISCSPSRIVINKGIGGNASSDLLERVEKDVTRLKPDVVVVLVGTNDMLNPKKATTFDAYKANLQALVTTFKEHKTPVVLLSLPPAIDEYLYERHGKAAYTISPSAKIDSINRIIQAVALANGCPYVDIHTPFTEKPDRLIRTQSNSGARDGVHPTKQGYQLIAAKVYEALKANYPKARRIVAFGDSITAGAYMNGAGTNQGDTYPAYLNELLTGK